MNELTRTRQSLLVGLSQRCDGAWHEFLAVYEQAIVRYCRAKGLQEADARDVTQDVLTAVFKRIESWDHDPSKGKFRAWLFRVARNMAVDELASRHRRAAAGGDSGVQAMLQNLPESEEGEVATFQLEFRRALFQWAAEQIRPTFRDTTWQSFWLTAVDGQKPEVVAAELNLSVGTVYTAKCRVIARLRAKVAEIEEDESQPFEDELSLSGLRKIADSLPIADT